MCMYKYILNTAIPHIYLGVNPIELNATYFGVAMHKMALYGAIFRLDWKSVAA